MIAVAIYRAASDGANVISLSLGGGLSYVDRIDHVDVYAATVLGNRQPWRSRTLYCQHSGNFEARVRCCLLQQYNAPSRYLTTVVGSTFEYSHGGVNRNFPFPAAHDDAVSSKSSFRNFVFNHLLGPLPLYRYQR